jgi:hypothetical protein
MSELAVVLLQPIVKEVFDGVRRALMQDTALLWQQGIIGHLLGEGMLERIRRLRKDRLIVDKLLLLEVGQQLIKLRFGLLRDPSEQGEGKPSTDHCHGLEQGFLLFW